MRSVDRPNNNLPAYARQPLEHFRQTGKLENPDRTDSFSPDEARRQGWSHRGLGLYVKALDENAGRDQALDQPGVVIDERAEYRYQGHILDGGEVVDINRHGFGVALTLFDGPRIDYFRVTPNGFQVHHHIDLEHPEQSTISSQSGSDVPPPERWRPDTQPTSPVCISLAEALQQTGGDLRRIYLDRSISLPEVRLQTIERLRAGLGSLGDLREMLDQPRADTPGRLFHALNQRLAGASPEQAQELRALRGLAADWMLVEDLPEYSADGVVRNVDFYLAPGTLQIATAARGWDVDEQTGLPIADSVVVGAGPGGLATGYHLSERGLHTVILEAARAGQAFSDDHAQSVHVLRTVSATSNLIYTGDDREHGVEISKARTFAQSQALAEKARQDWTSATGDIFQGLSVAEVGVGFEPTNRAELYDHLSRTAQGLSQHYPDTFLCEKSPVNDIQVFERGGERLFRVKTGPGHELLSRSLVMATGFVGTHGEQARGIRQLEQFATETGAIWLGDDHDEMGANTLLLGAERSLAEGRVERNVIASDRMLGKPSVKQLIKLLPDGSRVGVVGGGESAAKAVLEILALNPGVAVDLYIKDRLEAYQTQIPALHLSPPLMETMIEHPQLAEQSLEAYRAFGTPVTPRTLEALYQAESEGRLRMRALGDSFGPDTVSLVAREGPKGRSIGLELTSESATHSCLTEVRQEWVAERLYGADPPTDSPTRLPDLAMLFTAIGYDSKPGPLMERLADQGVVEFDGSGRPVLGPDGVSSAACPTVGFNSAGFVYHSADTTLRGRAVRAAQVTRCLAERLPEREIPTDRIPSGQEYFIDTTQEMPVRKLSVEEAELDLSGGIRPLSYDFFRARIDSLEDPRERTLEEIYVRASFTLSDFHSNGLYRQYLEFPDSLTPPQRLVVQAALKAAARIPGQQQAIERFFQ